MSKKHKCKLKTLPNRNCKKSKISVGLRKSRRNVNYDDSKYDALEYLDESENLSETIEISSEDSKEKKELEENHIENVESGCSSDVVILEGTKPLFESISINFNNNGTIFENLTSEVVGESKRKIVKSKSTTNNSLSSAVSFSSIETRSSKSENNKRKSNKIKNSVVLPVSEEMFYVEKILDMKIENGKKLFFLKWEGFSDSENTWEPEENIQSNVMVQEFLKNFEKNNQEDEKNIIFEVDEMNSMSIEPDEETNDIKYETCLIEQKICKTYSSQNSNSSFKGENIDEIIENIEDVKKNDELKENEINQNDEFNKKNQIEVETVLNTNIVESEHVIQMNFDKNLNEQTVSETCEIFFKDILPDHSGSIVEYEKHLTNQDSSVNKGNDVKNEEKNNYQIQDEVDDSAIPKEQLTQINRVFKRGKRKGSKNKIIKKTRQSINKNEDNQENLEIENHISDNCRKSNESKLNENIESITNENLNNTRDSNIIHLSDHSPVNATTENNDPDSYNHPVLSTKMTDKKSLKDPNIYFPNNMPQTVQEIFMVEKILNMKIVNGVRKFLLKWEGFPDSENTWEPEENLECPELIKEFLKEKQQNKKKRKRLLSEDSLSVEELPDDVEIKEPVVKKRGFPRSREADCILAAGMMNDQLMFLIKWKNVDMANLVSARRANIECPQVVIRYYEQNLNWKNSDDTITSKPIENLNEFEDTTLQKNQDSNHSTTINDSIDFLVSKINAKFNAEKKKTLTNNKQKLKPKLLIPSQVSGKLKKNIPKVSKSFQEPTSDGNQLKPLVGSSSQSMMNLIRNFKDRKSDVFIKPSENNSIAKVQSPILENPSNQRDYDSRDIPTEVTPQKIELPRLNQTSLLKTINSFKGDSRKFAITTRPCLKTPMPDNQINITSNFNAISQFNSPKIINAQVSDIQCTTSNVNNFNLTTAQNVNILSINPSLSNQLPTFNTISLNNFNGTSLINQQNINPLNNQQQISFNQYLQLTDILNDQPLLSQCRIVSDQTTNPSETIPTIYMTAPPSMSLENYPSTNQTLNSNNLANSLNKNRSSINSYQTNNIRFSLNQPEQLINNNSNPIPIQGYNEAIDIRNATRMQLAVALQSRYQHNSMFVRRSNSIPSTRNVNNSGVIYQNQIQHPMSPYQYINQTNYNPGPIIQHQPQQRFYNPQLSISQTPIVTNNSLILPKLKSYLIPGEVGQHLIQQQSPNLNNNI